MRGGKRRETYPPSARPPRISLRALKVFLFRKGFIKAYAILECPGCQYQTRWVYRARSHVCSRNSRAAIRRIFRAARRKGTAHV